MSHSFRRNSSVLFCFAMLLFASCRSSKDIGYFQDLPQTETIQVLAEEHPAFTLRFKANDVLAITVNALDPASVAVFNNPAISYLSPNESEVGFSQQLQTYRVDTAGDINFPVLGKVKVENLSKEEVVTLLEDKLKKYVKDPIVNIQLVNFRISILGEVATPGAFPIKNDRTSVLDALAMAGDLTVHGERQISLIREVDGQQVLHRIDLEDAASMTKPEWYVQQNDVIYVHPNKAKSRSSTYSERDSFNVSLFSAITSTVSVITSMLIALLIK